MVPFEELKELWQSQPAALAERDRSARASEFTDAFRHYGRRQDYFTEPSLEFVRTTIQRLYDQRDHRRTLLARIAYHLTACTTPFAAYVLGLQLRGKRLRYECLPLVERLRAIERALAESEI